MCTAVTDVRVCLLCSAGLGEFRIRDLNDEINKLLREKRHWEDRILELGGTDYAVRDNAGVAFLPTSALERQAACMSNGAMFCPMSLLKSRNRDMGQNLALLNIIPQLGGRDWSEGR